MSLFLLAGLGFAVFIATLLVVALFLRRVVPTNEVHIVQSSKKTTPFGKDTDNGNTYYEWPSWLPKIGIQKMVLPVSVFDLELNSYEAYDTGRVPFVVDIRAFFRIADPNTAAARINSFDELKDQLVAIVQGAARKILASNEIEEILQGRAKFGDEFTAEVKEQLKSWGVETVKNIELMDIRDSRDSQVIRNIMAKKQSLIDRESREVVAENVKKAEIAETDAQREIELNKQVAAQAVGQRTAEKDKAIGIANEQAKQEIKEQEKITKEKEMAVIQVAEVKKADIIKEVQVVKAKEEKETSVVKAEGQKQQTILIAEGNLEATKREAEGIAVEGQAKADAEKAMQMAPVTAQLSLAEGIGTNQNYQKYLTDIRTIEANEKIGIEQAKALVSAEIKVLANAGTPSEGVNSVVDMFSGKGGLSLSNMLETLVQSEEGRAVVDKITSTVVKPKTTK